MVIPLEHFWNSAAESTERFPLTLAPGRGAEDSEQD